MKYRSYDVLFLNDVIWFHASSSLINSLCWKIISPISTISFSLSTQWIWKFFINGFVESSPKFGASITVWLLFRSFSMFPEQIGEATKSCFQTHPSKIPGNPTANSIGYKIGLGKQWKIWLIDSSIQNLLSW